MASVGAMISDLVNLLIFFRPMRDLTYRDG